jgi:hypothetical protein
MCSPCHPDVGTGLQRGLCENLCDQWYDACRDGQFSGTSMGITPCTDTSLVCFTLKDAVTSGREFCEWSGFEVRGAEHDDTPLAPFLSAEDAGSSKCFSGSTDATATPQSTTRPSDPEAAKKRKMAAAKERRIEARAVRRRMEWYKRIGIGVTIALITVALIAFRHQLIKTCRRWKQMVTRNASPEDIRKQRAEFLKKMADSTSVATEPSWMASESE